MGNTSSATLTITNTATDPKPGLSIANVSLSEGNSGTKNAEFTVTLSVASKQQVTVNYATANGTATSGTDYTATSGTLTFAAGVTTQTIAVQITGDSVVEPNETFVINLSAPVGATLAGAQSQATGTITNDDNASPVLTGVSLAPQSPTTNSQLSSAYTATDAEGDALTATYVWKKNGSVLTGENAATLDLSKAGNGDKGDTILVTVTVSDSTSSVSQSASAVVTNSVPIITSVTLTPTSPTKLNTLTASVVAADADKDTLTYSYVWKKNTVTIPGESGSTLDLKKSGNGSAGDSITVTITATDGTAASTALTSAPVTVKSVLPFLSVAPQGQSDKVGAKRTFSVTVNDDQGVGNIKEVWLLINDRLDMAEGATLYYVPKPDSPTNGLLYLRRGDAFLPPIPVGQGSFAKQELDNGALNIQGNQVTVSVLGNSLTLNVPATIREGLVGQNTLYARVVEASTTTKLTASASEMGFDNFGSYPVITRFDSDNLAPELGKLAPTVSNSTLAGASIAPTAQRFVFYVKDQNGWGDLESVVFVVGKTLSQAGSANIMYVPRTRRVFLRSDDGSQWLGGGQLGSSGIIENSLVRIDLSQIKVSIYNDSQSLGLTLFIKPKSTLLGQNKIWLRAQDRTGTTPANADAQGYLQSGAWNIMPGKAPKPSAPAIAAPSAANS